MSVPGPRGVDGAGRFAEAPAGADGRASQTARLEVRAFGPLSEVVPPALTLEVRVPTSTAAVRRRLEECVPDLVGAVFRLALNAQFLADGERIETGGELAVLPPFAGG